jgi:hypothetical protein
MKHIQALFTLHIYTLTHYNSQLKKSEVTLYYSAHTSNVYILRLEDFQYYVSYCFLKILVFKYIFNGTRI